MKITRLIACLPLLLSSTLVWAGTIYTWTGADGVKRFSDKPPLDAAYSVIETPSTPQAEQERPGLDQMIEKIRQENQQNEEARQKQIDDRRQDEQAAREAGRLERIQAERQKLQSRIDALNSRALSPTFTQGMRQAQIEELQKQMNELEEKAMEP